VALKFKPNLLAVKKGRIRKPTGVKSHFERAARLLCSMKILGYDSLGKINSSNFEAIVKLACPTYKTRANFAATFRHIICLSKAGQILDSPHWGKIKLRLGRAAIETKANATVLTDEQIADIIPWSMFYVDNIESICDRLKNLKDSEFTKSSFMAWARKTLPCGKALKPQSPLTVVSGVIQIACYNLFAFHLGLRISEMLSAKRGFVSQSGSIGEIDLGRIELEVTTYKGVQEVFGRVRTFGVHPYLVRVARALEQLNDAIGLESEELFTTVTDDVLYETSNFNFRIAKACELHGLDIHQTSHTWRHTIVGVALRCLRNPSGPLSLLLGHNPNQSVAYGFGNPFIRAELLAGC